MAKCTNVYRTHMLHNRAWQQMNQIVKTTVQCVHHSVKHSLQFVTPLINRFVDDLLVKIFPAGAHSVFENEIGPGWKSECNTCSAAESRMQLSQLG